MKKNLTLEDAKFVINNWALTAHHKQAAEFVLRGFVEICKECERLEEQIEKLTPPVDSRHIVPVGDHIRIVNELQATASTLRAEIEALKRKCAARTLYGDTAPRRSGDAA